MSEQLELFGPEELRIAKPGKKTRTVYRPSYSTEFFHNRRLAELRKLRIDMPFAYGGVRGRSLIDHVSQHVGQGQYYLLDIKDAYGSVDISHLRAEMYYAIGAKAPTAITRMRDFIDRYATIPGVDGLPIGYPASPMLFNIYCREMDRRLGAFCKQRDITYTRWLDDLSFSSPSENGFDRPTRRALRAIITDTPGMEISDGKARLLSGRKPVTITGISVYPNGKMAPSRELLEAVANMIEGLEEVYADQGELSEDEMALLHGYNSVLHMAGEPTESLSPAVRELSARYEDFARRAIVRSMGL